VLRYPANSGLKATGGAISQVGNWIVHTFAATGSSTWVVS
jgi:hypothetical protein